MITEINGIGVVPRIDIRFKPDGWAFGTRLVKGDSFSEFRCPTHNLGPITSLAVRLEVTGRTLQRFQGELAVRVKVIFPGDGEEDTVTHGWMWV